MITVSVAGLDNLTVNISALKKRIEYAMLRATLRGALKVQKTAREKILRDPKSGRLYRRGKTKWHRASAPGESPASDTGSLARSIVPHKGDNMMGGIATASVTASAQYAAPLEYGTTKMDPRPFMVPSLDQNAGEILKLVDEELKKALGL